MWATQYTLRSGDRFRGEWGESSGRCYGVLASLEAQPAVAADATGLSFPALRIPLFAVGWEDVLAPHDGPAAPAFTSFAAGAPIESSAPIIPEFGMS